MTQQPQATQTYKRRLWLFLILILADGLFFSSTNPFDASPIVITLGGILMTVSVYLVSARVVALYAAVHTVTKHLRRAYTIMLALPIVYMLLMQSIGQLNLKDMLAIVPLVLIFYFYLTRISGRVSVRGQ